MIEHPKDEARKPWTGPLVEPLDNIAETQIPVCAPGAPGPAR